MSLVNDLLIELDRQNEESRPAPSAFLDGLAPRRSKPRVSRRRRIFTVIISATMLLLGILATIAISRVPGILRLAQVLPAVSARHIESELAETAPDLARAPAALPNSSRHEIPVDVRIDRPPKLDAISLERRKGFTRLRIDGDGALVHQIGDGLTNREFEIFFEAATLSAPLPILDLAGTPIRSISTESQPDGIRLLLAFDVGTRVQSQFLETPEATTLFLDLQPAPASGGVSTTWRTEGIEQADPRSDLPTTPTAISTQTPGLANASQSVDESTSTVVASEDLHPRAGMNIQRSATDRLRTDQNTLRQRAEAEVAAARIARADGALQEADRHYANAFAHLPTYRDGLLEWAALQSELGRTNEAIDLIRNARKTAAGDSGLAMLHARLLERAGRIDDAVQLLDRSGFSLSEAPDIHALAAAFLQRAGHHEMAIDRYEAIVKRYPGESRWWMGLGISLEAQARQTEALDVYRIALQTGELSRPTRRWVAARIEELGKEG